MRELRRFLEETFQLSNWTLTRPPQGHQKECYIAQAGDLQLFVKFEVPAVEALKRLGQIGVAPETMAVGKTQTRNFVVQEYLTAPNPEQSWFVDHLAYLATFIRRYHQDELLTRLLSLPEVTSPTELVARDTADLETRFSRLKGEGRSGPAPIEEDFEKFKFGGTRLEVGKLAPVHAEPNTSNMLLVGDRLVMLDWDEIRLGDPMQDMGLLLWWYVPSRRWAEFFVNYGLDLEKGLLDRIYWWAAKASLAIAFWQFEHGYDGQAFLVDFRAAVNGRPNPHAKF